MKKIIFVLFLLTSCLGQDGLRESAKEDAMEMGKAFIAQDFKTYMDYTLPFVYEEWGGKEKMVEGLKQSMDAFTERKVFFEAVNYEVIGEVKKTDKNYQCILKQTLTMSADFDRINLEGILLGISEDAENWKFAEVTNMKIEELKRLVPDLHPDIKIPATKNYFREKQ